jgi:hypothetical protein
MKRQGTAKDLAGDNHDLAPAGLFLSRAAVGTIGLAVRLFDLAAEIGAVDRDFAGQLGFVRIVYFRAHRLAQLVRQDERRLVLAIEVAAEVQGGVAFGAVDEDRDGGEVVADR